MINKKRYSSLIACLFFFIWGMNGQNLFDSSHTAQYAEYLFQSGEYRLASVEYERLLYLDSSNCGVRVNLIKSYRKSGLYDLALRKSATPISCNDYHLNLLNLERAKCHLSLKNYSLAQRLSEQSLQSLKYDQTIISATSFLYRQQWDSARNILEKSGSTDDFRIHELLSVIEIQKTIHYKKPWLSASMSTIIPGSGKVYSGYWKDGLISFLFIATSVYQSYRGFHQKGSSSAYGWLFAGVGVGFYMGNIYGSFKAANKSNYIINHRLIEQVNTIYTTYD